MLRTRFCVANWKMNFNCTDTKSFLESWNNKELNNKEVKTIFCPSFTEMNTGVEILQYSDSEIGAQNVFYESNGAYTGEVSCSMLKNIGCQWVIIGHSERRSIFSETDEMVRNKLDQLISEKMNPIVCIGEKLEDRRNGKEFDVIEKQISNIYKNVNFTNNKDIIIFIEARDNPIILKVTSLQLIVFVFNSFKRSSFVKLLV